MERCSEHGAMAQTMNEIKTGNALLELQLKHATAAMEKIGSAMERLATKLESLEEQLEESRRATELKKSVLVLIGTALTVGGGLTGTALTLCVTNADKIRILFG